MPYMLVGNCVHKQNPDKSAGKKMKCYDNHADAVAYLRALYANVKDSVAGHQLHIEIVDGVMHVWF